MNKLISLLGTGLCYYGFGNVYVSHLWSMQMWIGATVGAAGIIVVEQAAIQRNKGGA